MPGFGNNFTIVYNDDSSDDDDDSDIDHDKIMIISN